MAFLVDNTYLSEGMSETKEKPLLTPSELAIVKLLCAEKSAAQVAKKLGISVNGVKFHNKNIYKKLNCHSVLGMYKYALKHGIVKLK